MSKYDQIFSDRPLTSEAPLKSQIIPCAFLLCTKFKRDGLFTKDHGLPLPASFHFCFIHIHTSITDTMHTYVDSIFKDTLKNYHRRMTSATCVAAAGNMKGTGSLMIHRRQKNMHHRRPLYNSDNLFLFLHKGMLTKQQLGLYQQTKI